MITAAVNEAFDKHFGPLQHSTPPAPQEAQKREDKQPMQQQSTQHSTPPAPQDAQKEVEQVKKQPLQPLYQATMEDDTESTTKHGSSMAVNKSTLSTIPRLHAARSSGNSAACPSNLVASFFGGFLTSFFALAWHGLLPGYIECTEGMEATGQG